MINQKLLDYIKEQLQNGVDPGEVKKALLDVGWQENTVNEAFDFLKAPTILPAVVEKPSVPEVKDSEAILEPNSKLQPGPGPDQKQEIEQSPEAIPSKDLKSIFDSGARPENKPDTGFGAKPDFHSEADLKLQHPAESVFGPKKTPDEPTRQLKETIETGDQYKEASKEAAAEIEIAEPKKTNKKILFAALGVFAAIIIAGGIFAYYYFVGQSPKEIIKQTAKKAAEIKSAEYKGNIKIQYKNSEGLQKEGETANQKYDTAFNGSFDSNDASNFKNSLTINLNNSALSENNLNQTRIDFVGIDKVYYARASNLPNTDITDLSSLNDQWAKIEPDKITEIKDNLIKIFPKLADSEAISLTRNLTAEQFNKIIALAKNYQILKITEKLKDENISGTPCRHYGCDIDKEETKKFMTDAYRILSMNTQEIDNLNKSFDRLGPISGEIWIGEGDRLPYQLILLSSASSEVASTMTEFKITFKSFNKPVTITVPEQSRPAEEYVSEMVTKVEEQARIKAAAAQDNQRKLDITALFGAQKSWYLAYKRFYTCGIKGGDCKGKQRNFPAAIGKILEVTPSDPVNEGNVCGQDFVYCGLDNSKYPKNFCYYAKLADGAFFTASPYGNFQRQTAPRTFKECSQGINVSESTL